MGVSRVVRIPTPYNGEELFEIDYEQSADVMYLAHIDHPPTKLTRTSHTIWTFASITFGPTQAAPTGLTATPTTPNVDAANLGDGYFPRLDYYVVTAVDDETGQESRASNSDDAVNALDLKRNYNTISWTAAAGADRYRVYKKHLNGSYGYMATTTSLTYFDDNITGDQSIGPPEAYNPFPSAGNYPSTITFHDQRTIWGRTRNNPSGVWASRSGVRNFENMDVTRPLRADDAFSYSLVANKVNSVNQLVSTDELYALCSSNIFKITGTEGSFLTATGVAARRQIGRGSSRLNPIVVDNTVFYRPLAGSAVRAMNYSFELDGVKTDDMTIFSPHFFSPHAIVDWCYTEEPNGAIWAVRSDGVLLCFTWEQEQQVWGWTMCETDGRVKACCSITEQGEDRLYLVVERVVAGDSKTYVERMASAMWASVEESCYMDCARSYIFDTPQTVIEGLFHVEFRDVVVLADGNIERHSVESGMITLDSPATRVTVGLPFTAEIETLPLAFQTGSGTISTKRQQAGHAVLRLKDSAGVLAGPKASELFPIKGRTDDDEYDVADLLNGTYEVSMAPVVADESVILIRSEDPLPLTVTAAYLDPVVTEG